MYDGGKWYEMEGEEGDGAEGGRVDRPVDGGE